MLIRGAGWELRPIANGDIDAVLEVYRQCEDFLALGPQPKASTEMVTADMEHSKAAGGTYCGIWDDAGKMIGVADFVPELSDDGDRAFLELLMVARPYRSCGIGSEVVAALENHFVEAGRKTILSAVQCDNRAGIRFWRAMGYEVISDPEPQPDGTVTYRLRKELE